MDHSSNNDHQLPTHEATLDQPEGLNIEGLSLAEHRYHSSNSGELAEEVECAGSTAHKVSEQESETSLSGEEAAADTGDQVDDGSSC